MVISMALTYRELQFLASFGFFGGLWILASLCVVILVLKIHLKDTWQKTTNSLVLLLGYASFGIFSVFDYLFWWLSFALYIIYAIAWLVLINHLTSRHIKDLSVGDYELLEEPNRAKIGK